MAVFMDHSRARFIFFENGLASFTGTLESGRSSHSRVAGEGSNQTRFGSDPYYGSNNEYSKNMHEQELRRVFFHDIKERLAPYDEILIFGAGVAKKEMLHYLSEQNGFKHKTISVENSDYLTDNQLLETVRNYFLGQQR